MPNSMLSQPDLDDHSKDHLEQNQAGESPTTDIATALHPQQLMALPQQRQTQTQRQQAALHVSRQMGNQAFIRRFVEAVQRDDIASGAGDAQQQGATATPEDTPEARKRRAIKGALGGSAQPLKMAAELCADPSSTGSPEGNADQVLQVTSAVSTALTNAKNTK